MEPERVVPVVQEQLHVGSEVRETGKVRIHKHVMERHETIDLPTYQDNVQIERVPINQIVESAPSIRYEGDTMIIPLLEEVLVVEKRLMHREEVRVVRRRETSQEQETVTLRSEDVFVQRVDPNV